MIKIAIIRFIITPKIGMAYHNLAYAYWLDRFRLMREAIESKGSEQQINSMSPK